VRTWQESGWEILRNRNVAMSGTNSRVWIVGVDDPVTGREDVAQALVGVPPGVCRIGMGHSPDLVAELPPDSVDLLLCGHTHGGQIVLPLLGPPAVNAQLGAYYAWGLFNYQGTMLEVTRGVGMVHPLYRLNCPPEIALLTLHPAPQPLPTDPFPCRTRRLHSVGGELARTTLADPPQTSNLEEGPDRWPERSEGRFLSGPPRILRRNPSPSRRKTLLLFSDTLWR